MAAQIKVVEFFGGSSAIGELPAVVGQITNLGAIMQISGLLVRVGSGSNQSSNWVYDHELSITRSHAEALFGWSTGNVTRYSHLVEFPNGNVFNKHRATGTTYYTGIEPVSYGR